MASLADFGQRDRAAGGKGSKKDRKQLKTTKKQTGKKSSETQETSNREDVEVNFFSRITCQKLVCCCLETQSLLPPSAVSSPHIFFAMAMNRNKTNVSTKILNEPNVGFDLGHLTLKIFIYFCTTFHILG